ncbi:unnamed protein product [Paramecium pentaurelia]|uniref:Leucine rich repeat protein n=1 Tax=Paramecium pentaurelia TaxID=43138 RepID=A0A8S1VYE1_9CILI|nr:unnamed protein product [Paramecium pentaurelia]
MTKHVPLAIIQNKIGSQPYHEVKKLNLWGIDCEVTPSLSMFPNLQILQLSRNQIGTLKHISELKQLKELYLEKNNIKDIKELEYLKELYNLRVLSLIENPVVEHPEYKKVALKHCLALQVLDEFKIMEQDRQFLKEQELSIQNQQQNLDANSNQMDTNENVEQIVVHKKKDKQIKKIEPKSCQSSNQSTNGSKNRFDTNSQKISNINDDGKIYQFTSETSQYSKKKTQKHSTKTKTKLTKKQSKPQTHYIDLEQDSDCSISNNIKSKKKTLKKLKKLSDIFDQNSQNIQQNQDVKEQDKNLQESKQQIKKEKNEEIQIDNRNEQLRQKLLSVIQNLIQFIDKPALQCLYKILCEKEK